MKSRDHVGLGVGTRGSSPSLECGPGTQNPRVLVGCLCQPAQAVVPSR